VTTDHDTRLAWLAAEADRLVDFARRAHDPRGGFGWLGDRGELTADTPVQTWVTARMTHVFALATLRGDDTARSEVDHGVRALRTGLRDARHGGWLSQWPASAAAPASPDAAARPKEAYTHTFVVLAAASAAAAGHPEGDELLAEALDVVQTHFWDESAGLLVDECSADWSARDPYRGANANMHGVEAFLAAADVTGDRRWLEHATRITTRMVDGFARDHDWLLPEHFDESWKPLLDFNIDQPRHPFRPYGATIGHLLEWSRLCLHLGVALGDEAPSWLAPAAGELYAAGLRHGWGVDGADGFVYTVGFDGRPVVRERMHWVAAEATATAWSLWLHTENPSYQQDFHRFWDFIEAHHVDREGGSWWHELDPSNRPSSRTWSGKPDVYHAYQAALLPQLPAAASFVAAVRGGA
jgi:mannose/cellobiose epimerase-like protein (N-acyl-D-glucosamine 2-epimerase family)